MIRRFKGSVSSSRSNRAQIRALESRLRRLKKEEEDRLQSKLEEVAFCLLDDNADVKWSDDNSVTAVNTDVWPFSIQNIEKVIEDESGLVPLAARAEIKGNNVRIKLWAVDAGVVDLYESSFPISRLDEESVDDIVYDSLYHDLSLYADLMEWNLDDVVADVG